MAVAVFLLSLAARAATVTGFSDLVNRLQISVAADHEIKFVTPTGVQSTSDTITITFESNYSLAAVAFDDVDVAVDNDGSPGDCSGAFGDVKSLAATANATDWGVGVSGQVMTLTPDTSSAIGEVPAGSCIRILIGDNATGGAANDQIINPSAAISHSVALAGGFGDTGVTYTFNADADQVTISATVSGGGGGGGGCPPTCPPPSIFGVNVQNITETSASVLWNTDISSTSFVDYGTTVAYGSTASVGGTTFNHSVPLSGLTPGTLYHFRVRSTGAGPEAASGDNTFTTLDTTPPVLSDIQSIDITGTSARITWDTNEDSDSRVDYDIAPGPPYGSNVTSGTLTNAHSLTLTSLVPNTTYRYRVTSKDALNNSAGSVEFTFTTLDTVSPVISGVFVDNITIAGGRVNWTTDELANSAVRYGLTAAYGSSSLNGTLAANHQMTLTGLASGTLYHYSVSSHDASSNGATSTDQTFTTLPDTTPPANVAGFAAAPSDQQNSLTWTNPPDPDFVGVKIQRSASGFPATPTSGTTVYDSNGAGVVDVGLTNGTAYYYTAFAYDGSGNFASGATASGTPSDGLPPGPVTGLAITPGDQQALLTWNNPADSDYLQTVVQRSTTGFPATPSAGTRVFSGSSPSFLDTGLTNGTTYYYAVFAQDTSLNFSTGAQVSGVPSAPAAVCGNAACEPTETSLSCPGDCPIVPVCGDATCQPPETTLSCPADCPAGPVCGNAACEPTETSVSCPGDCPVVPVCGDATCQPPENSLSCPVDCPAIPVCGNAACEVPETPLTCPADCEAEEPVGPVCGNGPCEPGETSLTCSLDCPLIPDEPEEPIEVPEETVEPEDKMDLKQIKYYTHGRTLEVFPDEFGLIHVLRDVIFSVMIPSKAFKKEVKSVGMNFGRSSYLMKQTLDGSSYVTDIVVTEKSMGLGPATDGLAWEEALRDALGIRTAHAATTLYSVETTLIINYADGTVEVATPALNVEDLGRVFYEEDGTKSGLEGAVVTLSRKIGGEWIQWDAAAYKQVNPAMTDANGEFGFMAPPGEYRVAVEKEGFMTRFPPPVIVSTRSANMNPTIEMVRLPKAITEVIVPGASIIENIGNVAKALGAQSGYVTKVIRTEIIEDPRVRDAATSYIVPAAAAVTTAVVATAVQATSLIGYLYFLLTQPLLLLARRKRKEFGVVYNSLTKLPVDLAIVRLFRTSGKLVRTSATDKLGRYAFLVDPGEYRIETSKQGYTFPSQYLKEKKEDAQYLDLYHGETIRAGEKGAVITANVPMDPLDIVKSVRRLYWETIVRKAQSALAFSGVILTLIAALLYRQSYLWILTAVQLILFFLFRRLARPKRPKNWGIIYDEKTRKPIPFAVARIIETQYNKVLESRMTDARGRYNFLVGNNRYVVSIEKPGYEPKKTEEIDLSGRKTGEGVVDLDISMKEKRSE